MKTLLILDYAAEVLHLCYILLTALFRLSVKAAVFCYVSGQTVGNYYHSLTGLSLELNPFVANHPLYPDERRLQFHPAMIRS